MKLLSLVLSSILVSFSAWAECQNVGQVAIGLRTAERGGSQLIVRGGALNGKTLMLNTQQWPIAVDDNGASVQLRFTGQGQSVEIMEGQIESDFGASKVFKLRKDARVGSMNVLVCLRPVQGVRVGTTVFEQEEVIKLNFVIPDNGIKITLEQKRRFKDSAIGSTTLSNPQYNFSVGPL